MKDSPVPQEALIGITYVVASAAVLLLAASYFDRRKVESVAERGHATAFIVPVAPGGAPDVQDYFALVDRWVGALASAFSGGQS